MAKRVIVDSKTNYAVGCNAVETLLVDQAALSDKAAFIAAITGLLEKEVTLKVTPRSDLPLAMSFSPSTLR